MAGSNYNPSTIISSSSEDEALNPPVPSSYETFNPLPTLEDTSGDQRNTLQENVVSTSVIGNVDHSPSVSFPTSSLSNGLTSTVNIISTGEIIVEVIFYRMFI